MKRIARSAKSSAKRSTKRSAEGSLSARPRARKQPPASRRKPAPVAMVASEPAPMLGAEVEAPVPGPDIARSTPERSFAARVLPPEPERPFPAGRRAIFFDVENTSRREHVARVIDQLAVDRTGCRTDFIAVGNWKVIGHDTARLLAQHGAHLVHSAPSAGVRDWSDLRIAVAAGVWLAGARPGDGLEIVTNDRAFDAVGDVAASLGIAFRRLSHVGLAAPATESSTPASAREHAGHGGPRRYGRGRRRGSHGGASRALAPAARQAAPPVPAPLPAPVVADTAESSAEPHTAPLDEIIAVVQDLVRRSPGRAVTIDTLANALKVRGFSRPPGSPRLITRLRRLKEISMSAAGVITLLDAEGAPPGEAAAMEAVEPEAPHASGVASPPIRRRSRRGWRRRRPRPGPAPVA